MSYKVLIDLPFNILLVLDIDFPDEDSAKALAESLPQGVEVIESDKIKEKFPDRKILLIERKP